MLKNLEHYKKDVEKLVFKGDDLFVSMCYECTPERVEKAFGDKWEEKKKDLLNFKMDYQAWYSESLAIIKQMLPDRVQDFIRHYEKPKSRKDINFESYRIEDYLQGLMITQGYEKKVIVDSSAAIPHLRQQLAILKAVSSRFESSLFDIKQLVQADLFDSEIAAARELLRKGFIRASGAVAGVVLEKHLAQVLDNHNISSRKKSPTINDMNELLKNNDVIDIPSWRQIQRLGDLRNLCDHNKEREPNKEEVEELLNGVEKFTKTLF